MSMYTTMFECSQYHKSIETLRRYRLENNLQELKIKKCYCSNDTF